MFEFLLAKDQRMLIHCASGKDRTGFDAALILDVLGVEEDEIAADYLLTNACLPLDQEMERLTAHVTDSRGEALTNGAVSELRNQSLRLLFIRNLSVRSSV